MAVFHARAATRPNAAVMSAELFFQSFLFAYIMTVIVEGKTLKANGVSNLVLKRQ